MFILSKIDLGMALNLTLRLNGLELMLVWRLVWGYQRENRLFYTYDNNNNGRSHGNVVQARAESSLLELCRAQPIFME